MFTLRIYEEFQACLQQQPDSQLLSAHLNYKVCIYTNLLTTGDIIMDQSVAAQRTGLTLLYRKWDITNHKIKNVH